MRQKYIVIITAFAFAIMILTSCSDENSKIEIENVKSVNVEIENLNSQDYTDIITTIGTVKPYNDARISHEMGGIVKQIVNDKGAFVNKGDTILILDNDAMKASMNAAKAQYELAEAKYQRQQKVFDENVGSEFELLNTKYTRDQLKALYEQAKIMYEKTFIKAPFSGLVDSRAFEVGEFVPPAVQIVRVIDPSRLKIEAGIPERYAAEIKQGASAKIIIKELFDEPFESSVTYVGKALNPANRTFPIEIIIQNKNGLIKPDMLAEVSITKQNYQDIIIIPEEVITRTDDGYIVFVEKDGKAELRNIDILSRNGDAVAVKSGLSKGDRLIVVGFQNLVDGENVSIVN